MIKLTPFARPCANSLLLLSLVLALNARAASPADRFWPQWRGPLATGAAPLADPPVSWSETNNVKWKTPIPGEGDSTPIIWGDRVFILSAIPTGKKPGAPASSITDSKGWVASEGADQAFQFVVICLDRNSGKILWQKTAREVVPHEGRQPNNTFASASPVTDGALLLAFFGSRGLHCYDFDGNLKWQKDFGKMKTVMGFGEGASPALSGDTVVVNWDADNGSFITALDKHTGRELWRTPRDEITGWSTPLILDFKGQKQVIVNAAKKVRSYDLATGRELWSCSGQTANAIPSPVSSGDIVYLMSGYSGNALQAIRLGRAGDLTGTDAILWTHNKGTPYVPSPLLTDGLLYALQGDDPILSCFDAASGQLHFDRQRLDAIHGVYASPVSARDRVYVLGREGTCVVLKKGPKFEVLSVNKLEDPIQHTDASMALVDNQAFIRTPRHLYCLQSPNP